MSFQYNTLEGSIDSSGWHMTLDFGSGLRFAVASSLPDSISELGVNQPWGIDIKNRGGLVGTPASLQTLKDATSLNLPIGDFFAGITSQGSASGFFAGITAQGAAGGVQFLSGQFGIQAAALLSGGQVQTAGAVTFRTGDFSFGYTVGPDGSGLIGRFSRDPLDITLAFTSSDIQMGLSYTPENGPTLQALWSGTKGFDVSLAAQFKIDLGTPIRGPDRGAAESNPSVELPLARGTLAITPPDPWDGPAPPSVNLRVPLPAPPRPATSPPSASGATSPTTAQPAKSPPSASSATSPAAAQPAKSPSPGSGATLIVRACVVPGGRPGCGPADPTVVLKVLVDGTSVASADGRIPVSPGHHLVAVPPEAVPQLLVPLRGLRCDLTIPASAVGTCELPFRRVGTPERDARGAGWNRVASPVGISGSRARN